MNDSPTSNRVLREQLDAERARHEQDRVVVLAMMEAIDAHLAGLRAGIETLQAENDKLKVWIAQHP